MCVCYDLRFVILYSCFLSRNARVIRCMCVGNAIYIPFRATSGKASRKNIIIFVFFYAGARANFDAAIGDKISYSKARNACVNIVIYI